MHLSLAEAIFWIAALACVIAQLALLRSSVSAKGDKRSELVPAAPRWTELAWSILPALVLSVLLFATWQRISAPDDEHMHIDHSGTSASAPDEISRVVIPGG